MTEGQRAAFTDTKHRWWSVTEINGLNRPAIRIVCCGRIYVTARCLDCIEHATRYLIGGAPSPDEQQALQACNTRAVKQARKAKREALHNQLRMELGR